ncbi:MAG: NAD(P)/FAD-dependent oxidoreductase [Acidobacteriaceae bacterium]
MSRVVILGAGPMGLAAAYRAAKNGHTVEVFEAAPEPGGMAGHFDFDGLSLERFYHFVCKSDLPTFQLMRELGIEDKMRWRATSMGLFTKGKLHGWGDPAALLRFPHLSLWQKLRYGLFSFVCIRRNRWNSIENESARSWITRWCGHDIYERFWKNLFQYKFHEYAENISAAWIWTRIRRIGRSRRSMFQEELGYIDGGSLTLINALIAGIESCGGRIWLGEPVKTVLIEKDAVKGVQTARRTVPADAVISTVPSPLVADLVPGLPPEWKHRYAAIHNIGAICVIFKLRRSLSRHFWINVSEPDIEIPGVIEFSNLRNLGDETVVYVPYYLPVCNVKFSWPEDRLIGEAFACLKRINPALTEGDILATKVARLRYAQPVCEPGFAAKIPPVQTPIAGLQIADTCFYYPEDRGVAESVRLASAMANSLGRARGDVSSAALKTEIGVA